MGLTQWSDTRWKVSPWSDKSKSEILLWNLRRRVLQAKTERKWLLSTAAIHEGDLNDRTKQKHLKRFNIYNHRGWSFYSWSQDAKHDAASVFFVRAADFEIKFQELKQLSINYLQKLNGQTTIWLNLSLNNNSFYKANLQNNSVNDESASLCLPSNIKTFSSTKISIWTFSISNFYQNT